MIREPVQPVEPKAEVDDGAPPEPVDALTELVLNAPATAGTVPETSPEAGAVASEGTEEATAAEPEAAEPEAAEPEAAEPADGAHTAVEAVEAKVIEGEPVAPELLEAEPVEPKVIEGEPVEAKVIEAGSVEPEALEPKVIEAEAVEPKPVEAPGPREAVAPDIAAASLSRRAFLGFGLMVAGGLAGAAGLSRLFPVFTDASENTSPIVPTYDPAGKAWAFVVDTSSCIGCGMCVVACKEENHVAEEPQYNRTWVERHVVTTDGELYVDSPEAGMYGFPAQSTAPGAAGKAVEASYFEPRLCMQCEDSPCTAVCPVGATYRTEDGVVLVDPTRCIGCGYCVEACPYGARYLTPAGPENPNDMPGVADKCTWCYHRISRGEKPACVEVCPVGARKFGDTSDPASEIATLIRERNPQMLDPEYGTRPRVLYLGPAIKES